MRLLYLREDEFYTTDFKKYVSMGSWKRGVKGHLSSGALKKIEWLSFRVGN